MTLVSKASPCSENTEAVLGTRGESGRSALSPSQSPPGAERRRGRCPSTRPTHGHMCGLTLTEVTPTSGSPGQPPHRRDCRERVAGKPGPGPPGSAEGSLLGDLRTGPTGSKGCSRHGGPRIPALGHISLWAHSAQPPRDGLGQEPTRLCEAEQTWLDARVLVPPPAPGPLPGLVPSLPPKPRQVLGCGCRREA